MGENSNNFQLEQPQTTNNSGGWMSSPPMPQNQSWSHSGGSSLNSFQQPEHIYQPAVSMPTSVPVLPYNSNPTATVGNPSAPRAEPVTQFLDLPKPTSGILQRRNSQSKRTKHLNSRSLTSVITP